MKSKITLILLSTNALVFTEPLASQNVCDFDGDGYEDLAVGAPGESVDGKQDSGAVHILYGSASGITTIGDQLWHRDSAGIQGDATINHHFGLSLAPGDFNGDGFTDLAIGVPYDDVNGVTDSGSVHVLYGGLGGLSSAGDQIWHQASPSVNGILEAGDHFGFSLTSGDFDGDGCEDLAVGVPTEEASGHPWAGAVNVLYGSPVSGLTSTGNQIWHQDSPSVAGKAGPCDLFGHGLASGDFDNDGYFDLAIGVPGETVGGKTAAGAVNVLYGRSTGLSANGDQLWHQDISGVKGVAEAYDSFGGDSYCNSNFGPANDGGVTAADFNNDGCADLAIGVVGEGLEPSGISEMGAVNVLYGSPWVGLTSAGNEIWHQESPGIRGVGENGDHFGDSLAAGDFDGNGAADLVVGVPKEGVGSNTTFAGAVNVIYASYNSGLTATADDIWHQNSYGVLGVAASNESFGHSVATGDFNGDGLCDLAIGVPGQNVAEYFGAGSIHIFYGALFGGLSTNGDQVFHQNSAGIKGEAWHSEGFGFCVASGG